MNNLCKKCGATLTENVKFCAVCGEPATNFDSFSDSANNNNDQYYETQNNNQGFNNPNFDNQNSNSQSFDNQSFSNQNFNNQRFNNQNSVNQGFNNQNFNNQGFNNNQSGVTSDQIQSAISNGMKDVSNTVNNFVNQVDNYSSKNSNSKSFGTVGLICTMGASALLILSMFLPFISFNRAYWGYSTAGSYSLCSLNGYGFISFLLLGLSIAVIVLGIMKKRVPLAIVGIIDVLIGLYSFRKVNKVFYNVSAFRRYYDHKIGFYLFIISILVLAVSLVVYFIFGKETADITNMQQIKESFQTAGRGVSEMANNAKQNFQSNQMNQVNPMNQNQMNQMNQVNPINQNQVNPMNQNQMNQMNQVNPMNQNQMNQNQMNQVNPMNQEQLGQNNQVNLSK